MNCLLAVCPMLGCNHRNLVCKLPTEEAPQFEPGVYVAVKCANCGQIFRELAGRLEKTGAPAAESGPVRNTNG